MSIPSSLTPLFSTGAGGYQVQRSLRFNSSDSGFCSRTPAVAGNRKTWTWAGWVKRSNISNAFQRIFSARGAQNELTEIVFNNEAGSLQDCLVVEQFASGVQSRLVTTATFRDPSSWYHIVVAYDTTQTTSTDRVKVYVNNIQQTFQAGSYPTLNVETYMNSTYDHRIGAGTFYTGYFSGYLAECFLIDGQALTPSSFTEVSATTGQLIPKTYSGSYGLVADSTGALPIFNTTGAQGAVKDTGTRTDSNSASIVLALPMDGTNGGTSFGDQSAVIRGSGSAKTVTVNGNTNTSTAISKFYGSSGFFDGTGDYLSVTNSSDFDFGSGNSTLEVWVYPTDVSTTRNILARSYTGGTGDFSGFILSTSNFLETTTQTAWDVTISRTLTVNTWQHLAIVRNSNTWTYYINGVSVGTATVSGSVPTGPSDLQVGRRGGQSEFQGYMSDVRIYKGFAKYTSNFIAPTPNSFKLNFSDNSAATAATLGKDYSGNSNNWTPNNFQVSATGSIYSSTFTYSGTGSPVGVQDAPGAFLINSPTIPDNSQSAGRCAVVHHSGGTSFIQFNPSPAISGSNVRVFTYQPQGTSGADTWINVNGGSDLRPWRVNLNYTGWSNSVAIPGGSLSSLRVSLSYAGASGVSFWAVEVDGVVLQESLAQNIDSLVDTPTSYGTDTGVGGEVRGNYCTLNPLANKLQNVGTTVTLSNGNLDIVGAASNSSSCAGTFGVSSGKWYFEYTVVAQAETNDTFGFGIRRDLFTGTYDNWEPYFRGTRLRGSDNGFYVAESGGDFSTLTSNGTVVGIAFDIDTNYCAVYVNGTIRKSSSSAGLSGYTWFPYVAGDGGGAVTVNFGQRPFAYQTPGTNRPAATFKALCDTNIPEGTITTSGTYTGNGVADGPFVYLNGVPTAMTVGGNAVTFGTHADKLSNGFKLRTTSTTYNQNALSYNYSITATGAKFKYARAQPNP